MIVVYYFAFIIIYFYMFHFFYVPCRVFFGRFVYVMVPVRILRFFNSWFVIYVCLHGFDCVIVICFPGTFSRSVCLKLLAVGCPDVGVFRAF